MIFRVKKNYLSKIKKKQENCYCRVGDTSLESLREIKLTFHN